MRFQESRSEGKKHTPDQIVSLLRQIEVSAMNGKTTPVLCWDSGITEQTNYRWRKSEGIATLTALWLNVYALVTMRPAADSAIARPIPEVITITTAMLSDI